MLLALFSVMGCDANDPEPLPDELRLILPSFGIEPGALVQLGVSNRTGQRFQYQACSVRLERNAGDRWEEVELGRGVVNCAEGPPRFVEPTRTAFVSAYLPDPLPAQTYRFGIPIGAGPSRLLYSATFTYAP
jgi:hypothetical protein